MCSELLPCPSQDRHPRVGLPEKQSPFVRPMGQWLLKILKESVCKFKDSLGPASLNQPRKSVGGVHGGGGADGHRRPPADLSAPENSQPGATVPVWAGPVPHLDTDTRWQQCVHNHASELQPHPWWPQAQQLRVPHPQAAAPCEAVLAHHPLHLSHPTNPEGKSRANLEGGMALLRGFLEMFLFAFIAKGALEPLFPYQMMDYTVLNTCCQNWCWVLKSDLGCIVFVIMLHLELEQNYFLPSTKTHK